MSDNSNQSFIEFDEIDITYIRDLTQKVREKYKSQKHRRGLYETIMKNIISHSNHGYVKYIHPVDREIWGGEEINYTKWKLKSKGFDLHHRGDPDNVIKLFKKIFGYPNEFLVVNWDNSNLQQKREFNPEPDVDLR